MWKTTASPLAVHPCQHAGVGTGTAFPHALTHALAEGRLVQGENLLPCHILTETSPEGAGAQWTLCTWLRLPAQEKLTLLWLPAGLGGGRMLELQ